MSLIEQITSLLKEPLLAIGATIEEVNLRVEKGEHILHVAIAREGGPIGLDYIVKANNVISPLLDKADLIDHRYTLDVSSAGIEKAIPVSELATYVGAYVTITLHRPWRGENILTGSILSVAGEAVTLTGNLKGRKFNTAISMADIDKVREAIKF